MIKFIKLTDAFTHNEIVVNVNYIAFIEEDKDKNTIIYFISSCNTERSCSLANIVVKETINDIQTKMYL